MEVDSLDELLTEEEEENEENEEKEEEEEEGKEVEEEPEGYPNETDLSVFLPIEDPPGPPLYPDYFISLVNLREAITNSDITATKHYANDIPHLYKNETFHEGVTVMHIAATNPNSVFCEILHSYEFRLHPNTMKKYHKTEYPLFVAIRHANFETAKFLIQAGHTLKGIDRENGIPLLPFTCSRGNLDIVQMLVQRKMDVNQKFGIEGIAIMTPLYVATMFGHYNIATYLLQHGADVNKPYEEGNKMAPIFQTILRGDYQMTKLLLDHGAKINNIFTEDGMTPLHLAAQMNRPKIISLFLNRGANIRTITRNERMTPLHLAADYLNTDCFSLLIRKGAKHTMRDYQGRRAALVPTASKNPFAWLNTPDISPEAQLKMIRVFPDEIQPGIELRISGILPLTIPANSFGPVQIYNGGLVQRSRLQLLGSDLVKVHTAD